MRRKTVLKVNGNNDGWVNEGNDILVGIIQKVMV